MMNSISKDRISGLPTEVIHYIQSFLDMKEVIEMSLLSKRWRYIWLSLSRLNFNAKLWMNEGGPVTYVGFERFVERVLSLYDGSNIQKLSFFDYQHASRPQIDKWIIIAAQKHVEDLYLENARAFPTLLVGQVKTVELISVWDPNWLDKRVHDFNFPSVENLILKECRLGVSSITINAPELKYLDVENFDVQCKPEYNIKLCAPKLTKIQLKGYMHESYSMGNLSTLVNAEINFYLCEIYYKPRDEIKCCFSGILYGVQNVEYLTISAHCFKVFPELPNGSKRLPVSFHNLKQLKLTECRGHGYIHEMAKLLENFPNLENLVLEKIKPTFESTKKGGDWEPQLSFHCLKTIEIQNFDGWANEFEFLGFLLNNVFVLENITMKVTRTLSKEKETEFVESCKKLSETSKASSNATIRLMLKKERRYAILYEEASSSSKSALKVLEYH